MNSKRSSYRGFGIYLLLILAIIGIWYWMDGNTSTNSYTRAQFETAVADGNVAQLKIVPNRGEVPTGNVYITFKDSSTQVLAVNDVNDIEDYLRDQQFTSYTVENPPEQSWIVTILPYLIIFAAMFIFFMIMTNQAAANSGGGGKMMNFGKSRAKLMTDDPAKRVTFANVAGLKEEKEELEEIVDFLRAPKKYTKLGARIPKGVLLVGPPGTGKTLLAKAIAGEAGVPFFSISGSDFVEMFVGVGASRVRDLFEEAKKNAPCIVFIDEIDAVARRRGTGMGGGHDEREQTLNQMLVEMDGFGVNEGIIVMAATNRVDILDPAIMRPGRFDRKVHVGRPDVGGREEILSVHAKNKPLGDDVDLKQIAQTTAGFTGADLENLLNEAAIIAAKEDRAYITQADIKKAFVKVGIGAEKKSRVISEKEKRITAFHESGHAILFHLLPDVGPVYSVSIIPTGAGAAGYTMPLPERDDMFNTKGKMLQDIIVSLGGRVAEELVFDDITTGASQDIKQATRMAKDMVTKYGMSENIGLICYDNDDDEVFIGRDLAHTRGYGEGVATTIDLEVKRIIDECYEKAKQMIAEHRDVLDACANLLLEKEKISQQEFEELFEQ
ncbi:ATP-dependent metalloprotease FtsH [Roseburia hominis A2-183]|uniref:ATP-dependent zinc metalloprotease FtsH n=1 Tax=Roseburia hominis (strain DSM 16839 / JCM 17582 / NCIMB 14029 / A2-183) TaxID=585394 RepID=G2T1V5_ROSHA|nr:ATP-dependent zinc metalloprotease FtsH [Roseburia hominis]AEN95599.1 ATP-dependent metalloprotease FtsH [Roseburia hominis A2-183]